MSLIQLRNRSQVRISSHSMVLALCEQRIGLFDPAILRGNTGPDVSHNLLSAKSGHPCDVHNFLLKL